MHMGRGKRREASSSKGKTSSKDLGPIIKTNKGFVYSIQAANTAPETESSGEALCNKLIIFIGKKYVLNRENWRAWELRAPGEKV